MKSSEDFRFKIAVVGDGAVGKTSLIKKYTKGTFEKDYVKTIGAQLSKYNMERHLQQHIKKLRKTFHLEKQPEEPEQTTLNVDWM